jgi:membrane protein
VDLAQRIRRSRQLVVDLARGTVSEWRQDRVGGLAAEMAFWSVLSLVPMALALGSSLRFIEPIAGRGAADEVRKRLLDWTRTVLGSDGGASDAVRELFDRSSPGAFTFGLLAALWSSARGFGALIRGLDIAYDLDEARSWVGQRVGAVFLAVGSVFTGAVVLSMLVFGPLLGSATDVADAVGLGDTFAGFWRHLRVPFALAVMVGWAATVFHLAPNHRTPWRWDVPGACLTTVLWLLGSIGFRLYLEVSSAGANPLFGVLGGTLTLMLFAYVLAASLLLGGEVNALLAERYDVPRWQSPERRLHRFLQRRWRSWRSHR